MSGITLTQIETALEDGLAFVQKFAPLAALGGPAAGAIGNAIGEIAGAAAAILPQVQGDAAIIGSGDVAKITALQGQLQAANASLAAQIAAS